MNDKLINPKSIVIVGGSNHTSKPGGKVLNNIIKGGFAGDIYVVNNKFDNVQGIDTFSNVDELPNVDLAILAIPAKYCPQTVEILANNKHTRGFIILSAGFSEESKQGAEWEQQIVSTINKVDGSLIGPNCIGVINKTYKGVFTSPIPELRKDGCDFISASGAIAVYIMESGLSNGLTFSNIYSVGNSAQIGIEDVLKYLDETYIPNNSSKIKLLYMETISKPDMLLKHASSLIKKGCKIAAVKAGSSKAGSRAALSHTGALAKDDLFVDALLKKAGIVRCFGREELMLVGGVFLHKELKSKNIAIVTHAGGPAVMLTDILSNGGLNIPKITGTKADELLKKLHKGSSVTNPIDFLATGTLQQLEYIIDACENDFNNIDAICIIFGSPGLFDVFDVYNLIDKKMKSCKKPIFPIFPSIINAKNEIAEFISKGRINFPYEVAFGKALVNVFNTPKPFDEKMEHVDIDKDKIRKIIDTVPNNKFLNQEQVVELMQAAGITAIKQYKLSSLNDGLKIVEKIGYPIVLKADGILHKTDVNGVALNIFNNELFIQNYKKLININSVTGVIMQPMLTGVELFIGVKKDNNFGHLIMCGLGGIFIETFNDFSSSLTPINRTTALYMIDNLKSKKIFDTYRGQKHIDKNRFIDILLRISKLCEIAPEIVEMDINPLISTNDNIYAVDIRIKIEK